ncbi:MAG: GNAT family N-acetyltransferase, partial [Nitrospiria bacterium]
MKIQVSESNWGKLGSDARSIRDAVFIEEQGISPDIEHDDRDRYAEHIVLFIEQNPVATGRIDHNGKIGRVAVLKSHRRQGFGRIVMEHLEANALRLGLEKVFVHAQTTVVPFYRQRGYTALGEETMEAEIPHQYMEKRLLTWPINIEIYCSNIGIV